VAAARRLKVQIYVDVLHAIHSTTKNGEPFTSYRIERLSGQTHDRLRRCLQELALIGLVNDAREITEKGYAFLTDFTTRVAPVLQKYGLWNGHS